MNLFFITVHLNHYSGFQRTFESIQKFSQRKIQFSWIIKDGGSDETVIEKIKNDLSQFEDQTNIEFIISTDNGVYDAMNQAVNVVDSEDSLVLFLNAGDELSTNFIDAFDYNNKNSDFVYSDTIMNGVLNKSPQYIDFAYLLGKTINHQSYFIKVELLKKYPFKTEYSIVADWVQLMEIFKNETLQIKKLEYPIAVYEGGGISEKQDDLRIHQRKQYLRSNYSDWELESLMKIARIRQRPWYDFVVKSLDSPKRSRALTSLAKLLK